LDLGIVDTLIEWTPLLASGFIVHGEFTSIYMRERNALATPDLKMMIEAALVVQCPHIRRQMALIHTLMGRGQDDLEPALPAMGASRADSRNSRTNAAT
jgi:hypothetical protein